MSQLTIIASTAPFRDSLEDAIAKLSGAGFKEVDLIVIESWNLISLTALLENFHQEMDRVQAALDRFGVRARSVNCAFSPDLNDRSDTEKNLHRRRQIQALCRFMRSLGISIGAHYPGHIASWKNDPQGVWKSTVESLREIQQIARDEGVILAPEIHSDTPLENPKDARRLLDEIPSLPITYEPSHFICQGFPWEDTLDLLNSAVHCHCRTSSLGQIQAAPPAGLDALDWMISSLRARGYNGIVSLEFLPNAPFSFIQAMLELEARYRQNPGVLRTS